MLEFKENNKLWTKIILHSFIGNSWYNTYCLRYKSKWRITNKYGKKLHLFGTVILLVKQLTFWSPVDFWSTIDHWLDFDSWIFLDLSYKYLIKGFIITYQNNLCHDYVTNVKLQQIISSIKLHFHDLFFTLQCCLKFIILLQCSLCYKENWDQVSLHES